MMRGINRQIIFKDEEDYSKFLQTLEKYKEKSGYELYAYCFMSNHSVVLNAYDIVNNPVAPTRPPTRLENTRSGKYYATVGNCVKILG